jgi:lysophospholipase L1-like esterase
MGELEKTVGLFKIDEDKKFKVKIMLLSENNNGGFGIKSINTYICSNTIKAIEPTEKKKVSIEFLGDSITCAYGVEGKDQTENFKTTTENASKSYAYLASQILDADYSTVCYSGAGIISGYSGGEKNSGNLFPPHYEKTSRNEKYPGTWNFNSHKYDVIFINLGTNDNGAFYQPPWRQEEFGDKYKLNLNEDGTVCEKDSNTIINGVKDFLKAIRRNNPNAIIIWCWGMVKIELVPPLIQYGVEEYKFESGDKKVFTLELDSMEDVEKFEDEKGSRAHPGFKTHKLAANKLCDFIKNPL